MKLVRQIVHAWRRLTEAEWDVVEGRKFQWVARRWRNGSWEFRRPTAEEVIEADSWRANAP